MIDRERLLAAEHQARLAAEAEARRLARLAGSAGSTASRPAEGLLQVAGAALVNLGHRLAGDDDERRPTSECA